ncbi:MAG: protein kinase [Gemmatimonadales bacterium]
MQAVALARLKAALADRYVIDRELGRGGMAVVYLAQDLKHSRPVAIKALRPELAAALGTERFLREIETAARLNHPHIVPLYDSGNADGVLYYVMPFIEGETLRERIARSGRLSLDEALHIAREVGSALSYAHSKDVIHRDIKPANILLSGGHAVVADFGIARAISASGGPGLTQAGIAVGTPQYMSPEQVLGSDTLDGRSDIYSLGCVVYEMLVGGPPFDGRTAQAIIAKRFKEPRPNLEGLDHTVPADTRQALMKAFATEPEDRYDTASTFVREMGVPPSAGESLPRRLGVLGAGGLYLAVSLILLAVTQFLLVQLGLPDWVMPGVGVLLLIGLPVMVAAAHSEIRIANGRAPLLPFLNWNNAMRAGVLAMGGWSALVAGYMGMRLLGVGPVGTLVAAGVLEERERVVVADFENRTANPLLGRAVTEAFRVDLAQSPVVTLMSPASVARVLTLMERPADEPVTEEVAREVALREGLKAVVAGDVTAVGGSYVLSARMVSAQDGGLLAAFRETAADSTEIIDAVDRLSDRLRSRIGESLKSIRANEPLAAVTTESLEALVKYSQAMRLVNQGEVTEALQLLRDAVELDTAFAMAYRKIGVSALSRAEQVDALTRAYRHRDRLTAMERNLLEAAYHTVVTDDENQAIAAYQAVLTTYPTQYTALNNLSLLYMQRRDYATAEALLRRAIESESSLMFAYTNVTTAQVAQGKFDEAEKAQARLAEYMPDSPHRKLSVAGLASARGDYDGATEIVEAFREEQDDDPFWSVVASFRLSNLALTKGKIAEGQAHLDDALQRATELERPAFALNSAVQRAFVDLWFRGDKAGAMRHVDEALRLYPLEEMDPLDRPYGMLAQFYALAEEPDRARAMLDAYEAAVEPELRFNYEEARHTLLGLLALAEGRPQDAVTELWAGDVGACSICQLPLLGMAYDQAGQTDSVIALYERYVNTPWMGRDNTDWLALGFIYERLGQIYAERGENEQAVDYYGRFAELWEDADPELQPRVEQARREMTRLAGEPRSNP